MCATVYFNTNEKKKTKNYYVLQLGSGGVFRPIICNFCEIY